MFAKSLKCGIQSFKVAKIFTNSSRHVSQAKLKPEERAKLEKIKIAESNSFVQNIFSGEAKVENFFPYPKVLDNDQLEFIDMIIEPTRKLLRTEFDPVKVEDEGIQEKHLEIMKSMGSFGIMVPQEFGGMGCNYTQFARLAEEVCGVDLGMSVLMAAHQSIGYKGVMIYGSEEQKRKYLPELASGEKIACFALTEPSGGSDAAGIKSRAVLSEDGKYWILNGNKSFISNGGIADYFTVFAQTPVQNSRGEVRDQITAFFFPKTEGLTAGPAWAKMGIKTSNTTDLYFDNVKIPVENVLGEVGQGFKVAMNILNNGRYGMACALSGTMKIAIDIASAHANNRSQFGNKLASYTGIQEKIARMTMFQYTTQSMAYMLSGLMDKGVTDFQLEAAISKVYSSEAAKYVVDECLQILGGMGYMKETGVEKMVRDVRVFPVFEGTNDIMRLFVTLTGLQYTGGQLRSLQRAIKNPFSNLSTIYEEGSRRLRRKVGLESAPDLAQYVHSDFAPEAQLLSKNIINFGASVEQLLIKYGLDVIHEQMLLNRLSNAAIDIYATLVVLSRASRALKNNLATAETEKNMAKVICAEANNRINLNLDSLRNGEILRNDANLRSIAGSVLQNGGIIHGHPLN